MNWRRIATVLLLVLTTSGCTFGYRHATFDDVVPSDAGDARIEGTRQTTQIGATVDFRYFRVLLYGELGSLEATVTDERGRSDRLNEKRSANWVGLDVPLLSIWSFKQGCCGYPPLEKKRHAFELWASGAFAPSNFETDFEMALVYYFERYIGAKLGAGISTIQFSASTNGLDGSRRFSDLVASGPTISFSIVFPAGPWGEAILEELLFWDEQHREQHGGY